MDGSKRHYFTGLDGFRALAAIFILLYHSRFTCFKILWIGVPMFFVLSGFLITRLLLAHKDTGNFFRVFYIKRALRIFPIYYLVLLACVIWALFSHASIRQLFIYVFYLQNFTVSLDLHPEFCAGVLNHTWSLSVEELFYLAWPLVIYVSNTDKLVNACLWLWLADVAFKLMYVFVFFTPDEEPFLRLSLVGNIDGLMAGSLLGMLSRNSFPFRNTFPFKYFVITALLFALVAAANYLPGLDSRTAYLVKVLLSSLTCLLAFFAVAWLAFYAKTASFIYKVLTVSSLLLIGRISYGIYLYHNIVYRLVDSCVYRFKLELRTFPVFAIQVTVTLIVALLSWYLVEQPFLKLKERVNYAR